MADEATTSGAVTEKDNDTVATTTYVVGEHSVYKSVEDLIEGKRKADEYIAKLSQDLKEARATIEDLSQNATIVEQLKQIRENKMDNTENTNAHSLPEEAIKQIALNAMQEANKASEAESNLANCKQAVASTTADVELAIKNKAQELGCTVEYLEGIARTSPKAFKSMFGIKDTVSFESVNFLQGSRHTNTQSDSDEATAFFKSKDASPAKVAEFMKKAMANPSILSNVKW